MYGEGAGKKQKSSGQASGTLLSLRIVGFQAELERKQSSENKLEWQGFPWQLLILSILVITVRMLSKAPENKVVMLGMFPPEVEGKQQQAVCVLHAVVEMLNAHDILLGALVSSLRALQNNKT